MSGALNLSVSNAYAGYDSHPGHHFIRLKMNQLMRRGLACTLRLRQKERISAPCVRQIGFQLLLVRLAGEARRMAFMAPRAHFWR